jgi:hypothetical protein
MPHTEQALHTNQAIEGCRVDDSIGMIEMLVEAQATILSLTLPTMDPISVAASVITLVAAATQTSHSLRSLVHISNSARVYIYILFLTK